jgi:hypothetical protein
LGKARGPGVPEIAVLFCSHFRRLFQSGACRRQALSINNLSEYEKPLHQPFGTPARCLAITSWGEEPQSRSIAGAKHGFVQFRRRMEGARSEDFFKTHAHRIKHRSRQGASRHMKFSIEAKVAAAVAMAFAALTIGVIAQEGSEHGTAGLSQSSGSKISLSVQNASSESHLLAQY